jgi:hypothetical protein
MMTARSTRLVSGGTLRIPFTGSLQGWQLKTHPKKTPEKNTQKNPKKPTKNVVFFFVFFWVF